MHVQKIHIIRVIVLFTVISLAAAAPAAGQNPIWAPPSLTPLIEEGLAKNQALKSLDFQIKALTEKIEPSGALPDPQLGVGLLNLPTDTFDLDQEPMTQKQIVPGSTTVVASGASSSLTGMSK